MEITTVHVRGQEGSYTLHFPTENIGGNNTLGLTVRRGSSEDNVLLALGVKPTEASFHERTFEARFA